MKYTDDELRQLKQLTDEVFVMSNKPQLPLVKKMKQTFCDVSSSGFSKMKGDFYYCKTCDKEHKYPICKTCLEKCHKGHSKSDNVQPNDEIPNMCMCGYKCHSMSNKKKRRSHRN